MSSTYPSAGHPPKPGAHTESLTLAQQFRRVLLFSGALAVVLSVGVAVGLTAASDQPPSTTTAVDGVDENASVTEPAVTESVPQPGDPYFEAEAADGRWISYINPRDEYRSPYLGDGSGKICVALLNEAGEFIEGESVSGTTVTVPTGDSLDWHTGADPMTVTYPLSDHYDRPLDTDQFGTTGELPQGDGYLDSHCIEFHGLEEADTIEYGEPSIDGPHAEKIEVVGYVQQEHEAWDSDVDPISDAEPYEAAGGWTYHPDGSHGQAVVVLQLTDDGSSAEDQGDDGPGGGDDATSGNDDPETGDDGSEPGDNGSELGDDDHEHADSNGDDRANESTLGTENASTATDDGADPLHGFGAVIALLAVLTAVAALRR